MHRSVLCWSPLTIRDVRQMHSAVTMDHIHNLLDIWLECVLIKKNQAKYADVENDQNKNRTAHQSSGTKSTSIRLHVHTRVYILCQLRL
jgi:hypothetical protein